MHARDAVVVAGGRGTRLRPLTVPTPKPLVEFCGEPFLAGVVRRLARAGVERVLLVVGAETAPFEVLRPTCDEVGVELVLVPEPTPLDTAGGVRAVAQELRGPTLVLNGDILTDLDVTRVVDHHLRAGATATLTLVRVEDTSAFGVCVLEGDRITAFVEKPPPGTLLGQDTINAGTYVLEPESLLRFEEGPLSFERVVFPGLVADGEVVVGHVTEGDVWADLGTPERFREGHRQALDGALRWPAVEAVADRGDGVRVAPTAIVSADAELVGPVLVHAGAEVGSGARLGPHVTVGARGRVGAGCRLDDTILGSGTTLGEGVVATGLVTGPGAVLPDGLHIAGDTVVGPAATLPATPVEVPVGTRWPAS